MINERAPLEMKYLDMNHIRDPSDLFSMGSKIVAIILFLVSQFVSIIKTITRWLEDMNFIQFRVKI